MPKVLRYFQFFFYFLIFTFYFFTFPKSVYALQECRNPKVQTVPNGETTPRDLKNTDSGAEFTVDVNRSAEEAGGVTRWIMDWECGAGNRRVASGVGDTNIKATLSNVGGNCAFLPHSAHIVKVKEIVAGKEVDYCQAIYKVIDAGRLCELSLTSDHVDSAGNPDNLVTTTSQLKLSGTNIPTGTVIINEYGIFIDEFLVARATKNFNDFTIPIEKNTQGSHKISLRSKKPYVTLNPFDALGKIGNTFKDKSFSMDYGPSLCSVPYTVGDASNPGSIEPSTNAATTGDSSADICKENPKDPKCSSAGGIACNPETGKPGDGGILTAIGCVPSQPQPLVEGLIKFITFGSGGISLLLMIFASFRYITSAGNPDSVKAAWDQFQNALIGLLFVLFSVLLLQIIGVDILGIPGLSV